MPAAQESLLLEPAADLPPAAWEWSRLQGLPRIGPVRARQIVAARQAGRFAGKPVPEAWDELQGIGRRTVERVRESLPGSAGGAYTLGPGSFRQDPPPAPRSAGPNTTQPSEHSPP